MPLLTASSLRISFFFILFVILLSHGVNTAAQDDDYKKVVNIGAIIGVDSRAGKEEKTAMEIAIRDFNDASNNKYKLVLHVRNSSGDPLRVASLARHLIKNQRAQAILGMETWQEAALVAEVGNRAQVPVLSFATAAITPPLTSVRWPFLARMASDESRQMRCVAAMVRSYQWRRVIVIYEDDTYGGDSGIIRLLSDSLQEVGSEIAYHLTLPPLTSLSDPKATIREELEKLKSQQSRVFIIVQLSLPLATHMFAEAKKMDMMGKDSVWITTDSITSLVHTVNSSVISSMEGLVGMKSYSSESTASFRDFKIKFQKNFQSKYPEEDNFEPGIYALRAYDTISTIARAMERLTNNSTSKMLLEKILLSNFSGLSGKIRFEGGELLHSPTYRIVNVFGKTHKEIGLWSPDSGFSDNGTRGDARIMEVYWPGRLLQRAPRGWAMPTTEKRLKIGVPSMAHFKEFVSVEKDKPTGFCIDVFEMALNILRNEYEVEYDLEYDFKAFNGTYDDLVAQVYEKEFDAVVGDVTILANRSEDVEFTQPYMESGLTMIVPAKVEESQKAWMFVKPFTRGMWVASGSIFVYTMFIVWFLEHRSNSNFRGPWKSQLGTALWFTFSTLFFAHRERIHSNFTRVVIVVWLFVVLVLNSSYTASLTSMLTVQRLEPTVTDIESLKRKNSTVACDGYSFVRKYLEEVIGFHPENIKSFSEEKDYGEELKKGNIMAAFMELPYARVFLSRNCKGYKATGQTYRFGGFGFVFPKGSPIASDISKAILKLSENGRMTQLENKWFKSECSNSTTTTSNGNLNLQSFWGLFVLTGGTSTIVFLLYLVSLLKKFQHHQEAYGGNTSPIDESLWNRTRRLVIYFNKRQPHLPDRASISAQARDVEEWISASVGYVSEYNTPRQPQTSAPAEIQMTETNMDCSGTQTRPSFPSFASFPGWDRRVHAFTLEYPEREHPRPV